jgi:AcrR family transcriptional regulator
MGLFLERGVEATTIDDITRAARMAKGGFYRYFEDKKALVDALFRPVFVRFEQALQICSKALETAKDRQTMFEAYREVGASIAVLLIEHPGMLRLYLQENRGPAQGAGAGIVRFAQKVSDYAVEITQKAHRHGILRPIHPRVSALAVVGATERLLVAVLADEDVGNLLELPDQLTSLILDGLRRKA